ncbi:hypothetical protein LINPERPRIM_LOCUS7300 [Linum perenne]
MASFASPRKWAAIISFIARCLYFLIIILQVPLFRVPCTTGKCSSPVELTSSQLTATEIVPPLLVKLLLYPGAIAHQIVAGSYLSVAGAILGLLRPGRMSLFGALMILWGFAREVILLRSANDHSNPPKRIYIYPQMFLAVLCAFLSIRKDVRWLLRSFKAQRNLKSL